MKSKTIIYLFIALIIIPVSFAEASNDTAITEISKDGTQFKISTESEKFIAVMLKPIETRTDGKAKIPSEALVHFQDKVGVFIKQDGWYKFVQLPNKDSQFAELGKASAIAVSGTGMLRMAYLEASGEGEFDAE